jgi:uncharacterized Tic20 family protein
MSPQAINFIISILVLSFATSVLVRKRKQEPDLKLFGIPVSGIITLNLFAIMLFVVLLVYTLMGNPMAAVKPKP